MQNKVVVRTAALALAVACVAAAGFTAGRAAFADEDRYLGIGTSTSYSETINYDHKETVSAEIPYGLPYYSSNKYENECAPMAGTVLVGYYDRFCEDLVPGYDTYIQFGPRIIYYPMTDETDAVLASLYELMDAENGGATYSGFNSGMTQYAASHGYTYSRSSVSLSNLSGAFETAIEAGKPVAVFLKGFSFITASSDSGTKDVLTITEYDGNHVVVAYGYKIDRYYDAADNLIATRTYLTVVNGGEMSDEVKYLCLDGRSNVSNSIAVTIS